MAAGRDIATAISGATPASNHIQVFGAPLAFEALLTFFMESTFLGLWIFGWDRLSPRLHNLCMWMIALGTNVSALFILAANSWMQHPVGAVIDKQTGRARLSRSVKGTPATPRPCASGTMPRGCRSTNC